jgi:GNAT superfamily N-acetyltransferase
MPPILTDLSTPALVSALKQNFYNLCWGLRDHWPQAVFEETENQRRWWTPVPMAFIFNAVLSTQPVRGDETRHILETIEFFQARGRRSFSWWLAPELEESDWGRQLEIHGFALENDPPGMAVELNQLPDRLPVPAGFKISRVGDAESMQIWLKTFLAGYELPPEFEVPCLEMMLATLHGPWMSYLATVHDQPVAASSVLYTAGVAGIMNVATLKDWRGRGLGAAVTLLPLLDAREQGYRVGVLEASEMGYPVYQRMGFKEICRMKQYCLHFVS